jgi:Branched-chain amino acid aminotransferase/4-amino-4-deoxychorismate lyase
MFFETIKVLNGCMMNLDLHMARLTKTVQHFFPNCSPPILSIAVPPMYQHGLYRCRITYSQKIEHVEFIPYVRRQITTLSLIDAPTLNYSWKSCDRSGLEALKTASGHDEVIIVKNDTITDTTFSNLVFESAAGLFTPTTFLLPGVQRSKLISEGVVRETTITVNDLCKYNRVFLINAMLDLDDAISFAIIPHQKTESIQSSSLNSFSFKPDYL